MCPPPRGDGCRSFLSRPGLATGPVRRCPARRSAPRPPDAAYPRLWDEPPSRLFCLAPEGVCRAAAIAGRRGGLLPHLFTLTARLPARRSVFCGTFRRRALRRASRPRPCGLDRHPALRCPDFPLRRGSVAWRVGSGRAVGCERTSERTTAPGPRADLAGAGRAIQAASQYKMRPHWSHTPSLAGSALREPDSASLETLRWQPPHLPPRRGATTGHWRLTTRS